MSHVPKRKDGVFFDSFKGRMMKKKQYAISIFWSPQMLSDMQKLFPTTLNQDLADILGVSIRTITRKARELGLQKNKKWLDNIWEERRKMAQLASMVKGYPGKFPKGHIPHNKKTN